MYDKSKVEMLEYLKSKDDEIKVLNSRIDLLKETVKYNTEDIKQVSDKYAYDYWGNKSLKRQVEDIELKYSRMERKVKANSVMVYIQPFIWSAVWFFMNWLLK